MTTKWQTTKILLRPCGIAYALAIFVLCLHACGKRPAPTVTTASASSTASKVSDGARAAALEKACDDGSLRDCSNLGAIYMVGKGDVAKDEARAVALYKRACDGRDMAGCSNLGTMYKGGLGVARDEAHAAALYKQACEGGALLGCTFLGEMYESGKGVAKDDVRAVALYKQACDGRDMAGCNNLGMALYAAAVHARADLARLHRQKVLGGAAKDDVRGVALIRQACDGGNRNGCTNIEKLEQNVARAVDLYQRACDAGFMAGCSGLGSMYGGRGRMYSGGKGVAEDEMRAYSLYKQACDGGYLAGCS